MVSLHTSAPVRKAITATYRIKNAACPRRDCNGDIYFNPTTKAVHCGHCTVRRALATIAEMKAAGVKGGAL